MLRRLGDWLENGGAYLAVWITLLTFATQWAVTQLEVGRSALIIVVELVVAVVSTALLTEHALAPLEWLGAALVLAAAILEGARAPAQHT